MDTGHAGPGEGIGIEQLTKELGHIAKLVGLQAMNGTVLCVTSMIDRTVSDWGSRDPYTVVM